MDEEDDDEGWTVFSLWYMYSIKDSTRRAGVNTEARSPFPHIPSTIARMLREIKRRGKLMREEHEAAMRRMLSELISSGVGRNEEADIRAESEVYWASLVMLSTGSCSVIKVGSSCNAESSRPNSSGDGSISEDNDDDDEDEDDDDVKEESRVVLDKNAGNDEV